MSTIRIDLNRTDDLCSREHITQPVHSDSVIGPIELSGRVSRLSLLSWDVAQLTQGPTGRQRKRWMGELWRDTVNDMWWAQVYGERRDEAQPFYARASALDFLDRTAPAWKPRKPKN